MSIEKAFPLHLNAISGFVLLALTLYVSKDLNAQTSAVPPPPPPPPPGAGVAAQPAQPPPTPPAAQTPVKDENTRAVIDSLEQGNQAIKSLDLTTAQMYFEQAYAKCDEAGITGPLLARTYMSLGALHAGYLQLIPQGVEFMKLALNIDKATEPDKAIANKQATMALEMVKESMGLATAKKAEAPQAGFAGPQASGFWVMKHEPVTTAKRMHPLGVFVEVNPMVAIQEVKFYFRLPSDRQFQTASMRRNKNNYGMLIECDAIALLDPQSIYYYIEVIGGDGSIIDRKGDASSPIEIKLLPKESFSGTQPMLPGLEDPAMCNPDQAAPCPPWDPHCKDTPCVTQEDCLGGYFCQEGYCADLGEPQQGPLGIVVSGGVGLGAGIAVGTEEAIYYRDFPDTKVTLEPGFSPSWMFTRFMAGYFILDNLMIGAFVRFQHINRDEYLEPRTDDEGNEIDGEWDYVEEKHNMKISGLQLRDRKGYPEKWRGPMWGPTISLFLWGNGEWLGPGQVKAPNGQLADKQGFRAYTRAEFNILGAIYHEVSIHGQKPDYAIGEDGNVEVHTKRQHVSGMEAFGIGVGALYGVHKYIDIGAEIMYDVMFPTVGHNFDFQLQMQAHF